MSWWYYYDLLNSENTKRWFLVKTKIEVICLFTIEGGFPLVTESFNYRNATGAEVKWKLIALLLSTENNYMNRTSFSIKFKNSEIIKRVFIIQKVIKD